ncbi:MAG: pantoate--beta-alanine ligase [Candidatus Zixiibacteriota bacterium]
MIVIEKVKRMRRISLNHRKNNDKIAFVPTMGYLHEGHLSLVKKAKKEADIVIVSIFVNPTQFGPNEDLDSYPRDFQHDRHLLEALDIDYLFFPAVDEMYPENYSTYVNVEGITNELCGKCRPNHFRGVATIVTKLFNIILPDIAIFGQKDAQQALVIKKMTQDLNMITEVIVIPTIREHDGLAKSSRNEYLSYEERKVAPCIHRALSVARRMVKQGIDDPNEIIDKMKIIIEASGDFEIDYIQIVDLEKVKPVEKITDKVLIAVAAYLGKTRLIDNMIVKPPRKKIKKEY